VAGGAGKGLVAVFLTEANWIEGVAVGSAMLVLFLYGIWWFEFHNGGIRQPG